MALAAGDDVYIVEGEKDVEAIFDAGGVATCNPMGAGKNVEQYSHWFADNSSELRVVADKEEVGIKHAHAWMNALSAAGVHAELVESVKGNDAADALEAGISLEEAFQRREPIGLKARRPVRLSSVEPESIAWLWEGFIPRGKITDVIGDGDLGKSLVMLDIAARVSTGRPMPHELFDVEREPQNVLLLVAEDDLADTVVPRLIAAGADMDRIHAFGVGDGISFPDDVGLIADVMRELKPALVEIDPVMAFLGDNVKSGIDSSVRANVAGPLTDLAAKHRAAVMWLRHVNKDEKASAANRGTGSTAWRNATRAGLAFGPDHEDETNQRRHMAQSKSNLGLSVPVLAYEIESTHGRVTPEHQMGTPVVRWIGPVEGVSLSDVVGPPPKPEGPREGTKTAACVEKIRELLAGGDDPTGEIRATTLEECLDEAGFSPAVRRAAKKHATVSERVSDGSGGGGHWIVRLKDGSRSDS